MSGPSKIEGADSGNGQMKRKPSEEAQLERDHQAARESHDSARLAAAAARAQAKGTMR